MFDLRLLCPPYRRVTWGTDAAPPLGAIAIADASSVRQMTYELTPLVRRAPWCVPCLVVTAATADPSVLAALHEVPGRPAFVSGPAADDLLPRLVVAGVRDRPTPTGAELADYVAMRTGRLELRAALAGLLATGPADQPRRAIPPRTLRDRLHRLGPFGPRCWRTVGTLCRIAATMSGSGVGILALRAGVGPRSLRSWVRRYLALSLQEFRLIVGWEWVLEAALRQGGYVDGTIGGAPRTEPAARPRRWAGAARSGRERERRPLTPAAALPRSPVSGD